ncbi:poly-gamma-glutamate hydrolase family protein [Haloarcula argentinensis]|uniref:Uncharacterized protein n=1 Tax=Haloarcula argentinensis TaxID=43776 RepID=A0A847U312_HALAR|nr:poly-gamma-glutamate hydrolase family protein [Haloarcula argentinensis]NLV12662.1 hypothetical protein [Haloarcula argentinensis]
MTDKTTDNDSAQSTNTPAATGGTDSSQSTTNEKAPAETTADASEGTSGIRRRAVIAGTLGSPALFGAGFAAVDSFGIPSMPTLIGVGAASPLEQARNGTATAGQVDSAAVTIDEQTAQNLPTNRYRQLYIAEPIRNMLERDRGDQVRVTRGNDAAVYTISKTISGDASTVRTSSEGKCRVSFYEDGNFSDDRRWGSLRGDDNCSLADEAFDVEIDPRVPAPDLSPSEAEERGELIETLDMGGSEYAVLAPHGGQIQPFTGGQVTRLQSEFADTNLTSWKLQGYGTGTSFYRWYVPSAELSIICYPRLAELSEQTYDYAVSFNGINEKTIYVGGAASENIRQSVADAIDSALPHDGSPVKLGESHYAADSPQTLVNRVTENQSNGIWIGQPIADRRKYSDLIADAVGSTLFDS